MPTGLFLSSSTTAMTTIGKKDHPHRVAGTVVRRSTVTYALLCFLGVCGLISCAWLGYVVGSQVHLDEEIKLLLQPSEGTTLHRRGSGLGGHRNAVAIRHGDHRRRQQQRQQHHPSTSEQDELKWRTIPDGWDHFTFSEIRHHFNCQEHAKDQNKPFPSLDEWTFIRKQMKLLVDQRLNLDDPVPPTQGYSLGNTGGPPPYYPQRSEGKGRGLFASRDIKKGELVQDGPNSYIVFPDAMSFRRLVFALPRKSGCDITEWAWHQQLSPTGPLTMLVDANIAAFMNSSDDPNVAPKTDTETRFYAVRDIKKDEEILQDYNLFETNWVKVGLEKKRRRTNKY